MGRASPEAVHAADCWCGHRACCPSELRLRGTAVAVTISVCVVFQAQVASASRPFVSFSRASSPVESHPGTSFTSAPLLRAPFRRITSVRAPSLRAASTRPLPSGHIRTHPFPLRRFCASLPSDRIRADCLRLWCLRAYHSLLRHLCARHFLLRRLLFAGVSPLARTCPAWRCEPSASRADEREGPPAVELAGHNLHIIPDASPCSASPASRASYKAAGRPGTGTTVTAPSRPPGFTWKPWRPRLRIHQAFPGNKGDLTWEMDHKPWFSIGLPVAVPLDTLEAC